MKTISLFLIATVISTFSGESVDQKNIDSVVHAYFKHVGGGHYREHLKLKAYLDSTAQ